MLLIVTALILFWDLRHVWHLSDAARRGGIDRITSKRLLQLRRLFSLLFTAPSPFLFAVAFFPSGVTDVVVIRQVTLCHLLMLGNLWFGFLTLRHYLPR